jgi:hypothetical protein
VLADELALIAFLSLVVALQVADEGYNDSPKNGERPLYCRNKDESVRGILTTYNDKRIYIQGKAGENQASGE